MRFHVLGAVGLALVAGMSGVQAQQEFTVFASIVDGAGVPVASVQPEDLHVTENGADTRVVKVEPVDWPTKLQILVDNGIGLGSPNFIHLRNGVRGLIEALSPEIEVTVVATAPQPRLLVHGTTDRALIFKGLALLGSDGGAGRFVESLTEATQRIERDKERFFPTIISLGTNAGDRTVLDQDVERIMQRLEQRPTTVHVVMFNGGTRTATAGANQIQAGIAVAHFTGGRYENINSGTRIATLLPELGAQVDRNAERQRHQFRVTVQRPAAVSGKVGQVSMGAAGGNSVSTLSFDGRIP